ncbi:MAG: cytochrome c family protein [Reyranella sp.]|uniref:c-type cytochrome n=1 Tax=Reyranella sp. TaxID=1929291 RepID=UPI001AC08300|nr:cytochrome c family protein [Reyranella sp.]MBN9089881.1 cytochrome c family protein [Reyranella sp.]
MRLLAAFFVALFASASALATDGNAGRGEEIYTRCLACHALAHNRVGPRHCGLFGRKAGSVPNYAYSSAMKKYGVTWNEETLARFIENPLRTVPGTKMGYAGVKDRQERADLIAYLKQATADPKLCE